MFDINAKKQRNKQKKNYEIVLSSMHGAGGGQSVFLLLLRNGPKWSKMAQMVQKCPK